MYSHKRIEKFIDKVNKLAAKEANKIYKKHQAQLLKMIQKQLHDDDVLTVGMGSAGVDRNNKDLYNQTKAFADTIARTQYTNEEYSGFNLPYTITKTKP